MSVEDRRSTMATQTFTRNQRDHSNDTGFQFEFFCESCGDTWKTPFKPYRAGQANGVFRRFGYLFNEFAKISVISETIYRLGRAGGTSIEATSSKAKATALEEALALGAQRYERCSNCRTMVCAIATTRRPNAVSATGRRRGSQSGTSASATSTVRPLPDAVAKALLPRVRLRHGEHAQELSVLQRHDARQARFCTDCGHGFSVRRGSASPPPQRRASIPCRTSNRRRGRTASRRSVPR